MQIDVRYRAGGFNMGGSDNRVYRWNGFFGVLRRREAKGLRNWL